MSGADAISRRLPGKRAFLTGAASGLGLSLAESLAGRGWRVGLADRDPGRLRAATDRLLSAGWDVRGYVLDVSDHAAFAAVGERFLRDFGGLDLLVNAAGIGGGGLFMDFPVEHWRTLLDVNLMGVVHGCRVLGPTLSAAGGGIILNVASAAAFHGLPRLSAYVATKAAVTAFSEVLAAELGPRGVQVSVEMTTFYRGSRIAELTLGAEAERRKTRMLVEGGPMDVDAVAERTLREVARGRVYLVFPRQARVLWFLKRHAPRLYLRLVTRLGPALDARLAARLDRQETPAR